jgi:pilus assembly protein CpaB
MDAKRIALLVGALVIAIATALLARNMFTASGGAPQVDAAAMPYGPNSPQVLVAVKALPIGTIIDPESFRYQPWPKDLVEEAYYLQGKVDPKNLSGSVVRVAVTAGQPLTQGALIKPGDRGFLAAALGPGMRAVTVPVNMQTSVSGFIFPGDRVDLMLTQSVAGGGDGDPLKVTETIVKNIRVLATDQRTDALGPDGKPQVLNIANVTLEVTPKIAEKIAVAQTLGAMSLSLRSIADNSSELDAAIADGKDLPDGSNPANEKSILASIQKGPVDTKSTYATGADVSRYQRSAVPGKAGAPTGPVIHVARGTQVTDVPVGGN